MLLLSAATAAPHRDGPCLCIFDIDRTLTASQAAARKGSHNQCPAAHSFDHPYIKDTAYGGGGPLAFSEVGQHIENSFCKECWLGIISTGDAAGEGSSMRRELYKALTHAGLKGLGPTKGDKSDWGGPWNVETSPRPLLTSIPEGTKQDVVPHILKWYANAGTTIADERVFMFDDKAATAGATPRSARCSRRRRRRSGAGRRSGRGGASRAAGMTFSMAAPTGTNRVPVGTPNEDADPGH